MKWHIILLSVTIVFANALKAQDQVLLSKSILGNGKTLRVKITVTNSQPPINFDKRYDISNLNKVEIDRLADHVIDSLGARRYFSPGNRTADNNDVKTSTATDERKAIERAILNYVEGVYEADTAKIYESVAPFLAKRGYFMRNNEVREATMTFDQLVALTKRWNRNQQITAASPKKITLFDILDKTASAKVEAQWGIDYFHLAKVNGKWSIINVLWQDYPSKN